MINTLILKPSHRCNFNCTYCYDRFERSKDSHVMPMEECIQVLEMAYKENPKMEIIWHGGEPLVLGKEYLDTVMSHFPKDSFFWSIQTNGSLIDDEWVEIFKKHNVHVGISWDGVTHNMTRNNLNIQKVFNLFKEHDAILPGLLMTYTPQNAPYIFETYLAYCELFPESGGFGLNTLFGEKITDEEYELMAFYLIQLFDFLCTEEKAQLFRPFPDLLEFFAGRRLRLCEFITCANHWVGINPHGDVIPCGKPWGPEYNFGNILEEGASFEKIFQTEKNKKFAYECVHSWDPCKDCKYLLGCNGGCFYKGMDANLKYTKDEGYCKYRYNLFEGIKKVIEYRCSTNTLVNEEVILYLNSSYKGEFAKWRNYKSPII